MALSATYFSHCFSVCSCDVHRLIANYITFAVGEVLLLILTICSLAAIFPRVSYYTFCTFLLKCYVRFLLPAGNNQQHLFQMRCVNCQNKSKITTALSFLLPQLFLTDGQGTSLLVERICSITQEHMQAYRHISAQSHSCLNVERHTLLICPP